VDDVLTTGASLTAAARALRAGGAGAVVGLVAARTPHPRTR
jgi:predicted amidophosphoribosyltransferase